MLNQMDGKTIAVIGNGIIGHGIAELFAKAGYTVVLIGRNEASLNRALERIKTSLGEFAEEGLAAESDVSVILSRISLTIRCNLRCFNLSHYNIKT
ncbi:NAD(P)-binding domain-containing protein [Treponema sp. OMZ 305]|uniref:3-hydroxyacyl-CoA dehydrogenase NAD-binding domain-containing protein n=1 Tax=Treponema TaxID=157 RepID=UPI001BAE7DC8|nr:MULTISPECIES: 3-hydroxyacyl-CoA dehydrogenase NAD-binding domain-containing protein [Treponema]QUY18273.1 NAD(P)-binding domain-containing protein [Treponema vincentii]UTC57914.1 NAD(P)-binding domain-containing protein [Treponema sp. OMZ 305]